MKQFCLQNLFLQLIHFSWLIIYFVWVDYLPSVWILNENIFNFNNLFMKEQKRTKLKNIIIKNQLIVRYNRDFVRYNRDLLLIKDWKPNQWFKLVHYNREFVITEFVITEFVITEFDCTRNLIIVIIWLMLSVSFCIREMT